MWWFGKKVKALQFEVRCLRNVIRTQSEEIVDLHMELKGGSTLTTPTSSSIDLKTYEITGMIYDTLVAENELEAREKFIEKHGNIFGGIEALEVLDN